MASSSSSRSTNQILIFPQMAIYLLEKGMSMTRTFVWVPLLDWMMERFCKSKLKIFSRMIDPTVVDDWLNNMKELFDGMNYPEERSVTLVSILVEGKVETWRQNHHQLNFWERKRFNGRNSWISFRNGTIHHWLGIILGTKWPSHYRKGWLWLSMRLSFCISYIMHLS